MQLPLISPGAAPGRRRRNGLLLALALALAGCSTSREDQAFYESGWLWPRKLDTPDRAVTAGEKADAAAAARDPRRDW